MQLALKLILRQETLAREVLSPNIMEITAQGFHIFSSRVMLLLTQVLGAMAPAPTCPPCSFNSEPVPWLRNKKVQQKWSKLIISPP